MLSNKTISIINKVVEGKIKKAELKTVNRKTITSATSKTKLTIENGIVTLNKTHKPSVAALHSKGNLYRTVRAVWDLTKALDVELAENDVKLHVDKYVNAVRADDNPNTFSEKVVLKESTAKHKVLNKDVKVDYVIIGARLVEDTVIPFIECNYIAELEVGNNED